ncbi:hypothetical protein V1264_017635 [Littorina saxatilis]|uniref:Uncharacterized protein n=1 Tax=Littorina saxatilis TaxID=31220 RepID=A0AAN9GGX9_9CAEN
MITELEGVNHVCVTADCWTSRHSIFSQISPEPADEGDDEDEDDSVTSMFLCLKKPPPHPLCKRTSESLFSHHWTLFTPTLR